MSSPQDILNKITDKVLAYRPKAKSKSAKKRAKTAKRAKAKKRR